MIIIKNIILYFIQIRHTDDFPSTGTRLVSIIQDVKYTCVLTQTMHAPNMDAIPNCHLVDM